MISLSQLILNKYISWGNDEVFHRTAFYMKDRTKGSAQVSVYMHYPRKVICDVFKIRVATFHAITGVYYSRSNPIHPPVYLDIDDMALELKNIRIDKIFEYAFDRFDNSHKATVVTDVNIYDSIIKKDVMEYYIDFQPKEMIFTDCEVEE